MHSPLNVQSVFPFPVWALPTTLRAAVEEAVAVTQAPPALVASSALAAASLAVQAKFDVKRLDGLTSPCSLFLITFAESGERKTTVDRMFFDAFNKFEKVMSSESVESKDKDQGERPSQEQTQSGKLRLLYSDTTPIAFLHGINQNSRSAGLCEDEAGRIFNSRLVDDLGLLNKLWNGSDVTVDRRYESFSVRSPRCTIAWLVQPAVFTKFMERRGDDARGIGFLARCLVSYPVSTQGTRFLRGLPQDLTAIRSFSDRVFALLHDQTDRLQPQLPVTDKVVLRFSPAAQVEWEKIFNNIEYATRPGGQFCEARDYASKVAENVARVAGVFHAFEGSKDEEISVDTLSSAANVVLWYTCEFVRLFTPPGPHEVINGYARLLDNWLIEYVRGTQLLAIPRNDILQLGPNKLRRRDILNIAIQRLIFTNRVCSGVVYPPSDGRKSPKGSQTLQLNDAYYGQIVRGIHPCGFEPL